MNSLLNSMSLMANVWNDFVANFAYPWMWFATAFAVIGVTLLILSRRIARIIKQRNNIEDNDGAYITFLVISLLFIIASVILFIVMG